MLKRLIEVALPLKEVSDQSAREKSIRHGHISTLHIWWARRPLAACRAIIFASLIPDPDDPECPEEFRTQVKQILNRNEFKPKNGNGSAVEDTPRNRCIEFIKYLVRWENSNNPEYIEPARKLIAAAHKLLHPDSDSDAPKVLDPFAGGGSIPLEALRLGCESHAVELNPVAHLIEFCTLVYPQKYGQSDSRPIPDYIKRLVAHNRANRRAKGETDLFENADSGISLNEDEFTPSVEITEKEYRDNPLTADVKYWGSWIHAAACQELQKVYAFDSDGRIPAAFLWARTVSCPNPSCRATIPLLRHLWLNSKQTTKVAMRMSLDQSGRKCVFDVEEASTFDFEPSNGTILRGTVQCPFCRTAVQGSDLRAESVAGRMGQQLLAVGTVADGDRMRFRNASDEDNSAFRRAKQRLDKLRSSDGNALSNYPNTGIVKKW